GLADIPGHGLLCWSVPGCVAGWEDLRATFGSKSLAEILAPAIDYAENGFAVTEIIAGGWKASTPVLNRWPDTAKTYLPGGHAPGEGEIFRNPNLAASYRAIAKEGPAAFYKGSIAQKIVSFSEANEGYLSL